jgi:hypothetical protein
MDTWPYAIAIFVVALLLLLVTLGVIGPTSGKNLNLDNLTVHSIHGNSPIEIQDDLTFGGEHSVLETLKVESQEFSVTNQFHFPKTRATVPNSVLSDVQADGQLEWLPLKDAPTDEAVEVAGAQGPLLQNAFIDLPDVTTGTNTIFSGDSLRAWADVSYSVNRIYGRLWVSQTECNQSLPPRQVNNVEVDMKPVFDAIREAGGPSYIGLYASTVVGSVHGSVVMNSSDPNLPGSLLWGKIETYDHDPRSPLLNLMVVQDESSPRETYTSLVSVYFSAEPVLDGLTK